MYIPDHRERANRRREVRPARTEPKRPEIAAELPKAVTDAAASAAEERKFSFAAAPTDGAEVIRMANADAYRDDTDSAFRFFQEDR